MNLYNSGYVAYFMNRVGTYRVDRRKKNEVYLATLKGMSNLAIQHNTNSLFFPGGTRSRSGAIETKLKRGLLGTCLEAQRSIYASGENRKVFIIPLTLTYPSVLEAKPLIEQYFSKVGNEEYLRLTEEPVSGWQIINGVRKLMNGKDRIIFSFGKPMDVMGNYVDANGESLDGRGNKIDIKTYFYRRGEIVKDLQRESVYTSYLAEKLVDEYHRSNVVTNSHLLAFVYFKMVQKTNAQLDLFDLLNLPVESFKFSRDEVGEVLERMKNKLLEMASQDKIKLSKDLSSDIDELIEKGIRKLGIYHPMRPLYLDKKKNIRTENLKTLYYYHNRLSTYGLEKDFDWGIVEEGRTA